MTLQLHHSSRDGGLRAESTPPLLRVGEMWRVADGSSSGAEGIAARQTLLPAAMAGVLMPVIGLRPPPPARARQGSNG